VLPSPAGRLGHHQPEPVAVIERSVEPHERMTLAASERVVPAATAEPRRTEGGQSVTKRAGTIPAIEHRTAQTAPEPRRGSKVEILLSMVSREEGASLDELVATLGNLAHSIRASISVESRKRGLNIECINSRYYLRAGPTTAASEM
jgi:hypothetical protein